MQLMSILAFERGVGSVSIPLLCFFTFMAGVGGCASFAGAVKTGILHLTNVRSPLIAYSGRQLA